TLEHFDAVDMLHTRVVVTAVADKQARRHRHTVFENQRLVVRSAEATNTDIGDHSGLFFRLDVNARHPTQHLFGGHRLDHLDLFARHLRYRAGLLADILLTVANHVDTR